VLLVDDNALFLEGLRNMLEASEVVVLGMAANAEEAIEQARALQPEVVLMDVQMPGESGIEATRTLKGLFPEMKIVMMTVSESDEHLFDAIAAGANGYLLKSGSPDEFAEALAGAARGEAPLSAGLAARIMAEFARRDRERETGELPVDPAAVLSERKMEILRQVALGHPYREIARNLGLSEATIKYHMGEITGHLHVKNRSQAIAYARKRMPPSYLTIN
jgi:two-component system NarL family response regulator